MTAVTSSCSGGLSGVVKQPKPVTATTELKPNDGSVIFSDDFHDSGSGWSTDTTPEFSASFTKSGYVVVGRTLVDNEVSAPYVTPKDQLSVSVDATESADSPVGSGFGAGCSRGPTDNTISYDFAAEVGATWELFRHDTRPGVTDRDSLLKKGTSPQAPGAKLLTVELMCATLTDGVTTRLVMFVNDTQVADITDPVANLSRLGWLGGLVVRSVDSGPTAVTAIHFEERDLTF